MAKIDPKTIEGFDNMTPEQKLQALLGLDVPDPVDLSGYVKKDALDKVSSEAAAYKKQLREKQTAEETSEAERRAAQERLESELAELKKDKAVSENKARLLGIGYEEALATETAKAIVDGNLDLVFTNQKKHQESIEKAIRAKLLENTPPPGPGSAAGGEEKSESVKLAEQLGKTNAESNKTSGDIISQYIGGKV